MKIAAIVVGLLIFSVILMGSVAGCGYRHTSPEERADHIIEKVKKKLSLNEDQVTKLEIVKSEFLMAGKDMKAKRKQIRTSVSEMLEQPTLDQERILSMVREKTQTLNEKAPQVVVALAGFYDSLTPEQQSILREKIKDRIEHRKHSLKYN